MELGVYKVKISHEDDFSVVLELEHYVKPVQELHICEHLSSPGPAWAVLLWKTGLEQLQ